MTTFAQLCEAAGLACPVPEYRFHPTRRWRWDWAWPEDKLAVEVNGGAWVGGRHTRGAGYARDLEKWSAGAALGWRIIHVTPRQFARGDALALVRAALDAEGV